MSIGRFSHHLKFLYLTLTLAMILALALTLALTPEIQAQSSKKDPAVKVKSDVSNKKSAKSKKSTAKSAKPKDPPLPWPQNVQALAGDGAVLVLDNHATPGAARELYAYNIDRSYVPASILKVITMGAALEFFGPGYRFKTDFLLTRDKDLWVVGYGDPYLISEELVLIVEALQKRGLREVRNIYIDDSYFEKDLILDGNTQTLSPYDAYNLAFGVNFNTINFQKNKKGAVSRAAANAPLTPLALEKAAKTKGAGIFRLNIHESPGLAEIHAGQTLKAHLEDGGITVTGEIFAGQTAPRERKIFYRHESSKTLELVVKDLMKHSNNFMTNQIFLALGAESFGAPASLEKSQKAMDIYFSRHGLPRVIMGDGSGLSRQTTVTAAQMAGILQILEPDRYLFPVCDHGLALCKTGTMSDIKTLVGYLERPDAPDQPLAFVILLNGANYPPHARFKILDMIKEQFNPAAPTPSAGR
ncbi:MAG: D-alanyl-D-alanine carboxypeptidase [Candidatus Adiutrix sp.]|jgi:D-alanyl-D-alanine carboxypeptidase/D-alanyl-D-alanine-endopeptidase (penicillin-binding protein 4)|nr:D-alanyl-D-alanine carboxypeptidase [Candidatus Adiutrix sp.]